MEAITADTSAQQASNRHRTANFFVQKSCRSMSRSKSCLRLSYERGRSGVKLKRSNNHEVHFADVRKESRSRYIPGMDEDGHRNPYGRSEGAQPRSRGVT